MAERNTRLAYTKDEDDAISKYIAENARGEGKQGSIKGNAIWKEMESEKITEHPWKSMRDRYLKQISKSENSQNRDLLNHLLNDEKNVTSKIENVTSAAFDKEKQEKQRHRYTTEEDDAIVKYVHMFGKEYGEVGSTKGNLIWKRMEQCKVTSHPWQSMKDRYLKYLVTTEPKEDNNDQLTLRMYDGKPILCLNETAIKRDVGKENTFTHSLVEECQAKDLSTYRSEEVKEREKKGKRKPLFSHNKNYSLMDHQRNNSQAIASEKSSAERSSLWVYDTLQSSTIDELVEASDCLTINDAPRAGSYKTN